MATKIIIIIIEITTIIIDNICFQNQWLYLIIGSVSFGQVGRFCGFFGIKNK